jgi:hypothetical protein
MSTDTASMAASVLREAADIVEGSRNATHGAKERSFGAICDIWNAYLEGRADVSVDAIRPVDVAMMMVLMKMVRANQGQPIRDHFVDMAGYAGIAGELGATDTASHTEDLIRIEADLPEYQRPNPAA